MNVAVQDLHRVIQAAHKLGGKVVLGGHSLGGSVVTAYATWNFNGQPEPTTWPGWSTSTAAACRPSPPSDATAALRALKQQATPWLTFGGIAAPFAGLFNATGSLGALQDPNARSLGQQFGPLPSDLEPPVPVTNLGQYGYALNVGTSPASLVAAQAHLGKGVSTTTKNGLHGWDGTRRADADQALCDDVLGDRDQQRRRDRVVLPAAAHRRHARGRQRHRQPRPGVLDVHSTMGRRLRRTLKIYAFGAALGGQGVLLDAQQLAKQSHIPKRNLVLINRHSTYAHNDPAGAFPNNVFFDHLVPFLSRIAHG